MKETQTHAVVREGYARVAKQTTGCCGPAGRGAEIDIAKRIGYSDAEAAGPAAAGNLGLGCGNPTAIADLQPGEVVVDLGSGAGFDALLAAEKLGSVAAMIGCVAGAETEEAYLGHIREAGFVDIELQRRPTGEVFDFATDDPVISAAIAEFGIERAKEVAESIFSYTIEARKP